jgi:hypothetical protein
MNKRQHCAKKIIPMVASKLKHPRLNPSKIMANSEYIANAIYNKLGDNTLPADVDNALIEVITACGIGQRNVLGVDCSRLTNENFKANIKKNMNRKEGESKKMSLFPLLVLVIIVILIIGYIKYLKN